MSARFFHIKNTRVAVGRHPLTVLIALAFAFLALMPVSKPLRVGAWSSDTTMNTPICTAVYDQGSPAVTGDGSGGVIITWVDSRDANSDIYAQRVDSLGAPLWTANGVPICTAAGGQGIPVIVSDGSGGAIIAWRDFRNEIYGDVYAQRVDSSGVTRWTANGVPMCTLEGGPHDIHIVSDGSGGAIVAWKSYRLPTNGVAEHVILAQRVDPSGTPQWTDNGISLCVGTVCGSFAGMVADGSGGAIATWWDSSAGYGGDIYAQRVDSSGVLLWPEARTAVCTAYYGQYYTAIVGDGSGGAIIAWHDQRYFNDDIYAQRVDSSGMPLWTDNGTVIVATPGVKSDRLSMLGDGSGSAIIAWQEECTSNVGNKCGVYAQKVNSGGVTQWSDEGIAVCTKVYNEHHVPEMVSDGSGGFITAWYCDYAIYAQRVDSSGMPQWSDGGTPLCTVLGDIGDGQRPALAGDGSGGAVVAWRDMRSPEIAFVGDIYAQKVNAWGGRSGVGAPPDQPSNISPTNGSTWASLIPTLQSSDFSDPDPGDIHAASQWRIAATAGEYSGPVFDSGTDSTNLTQITVPSQELNANTTYYWQVRYQEDDGAWSDWSVETSFTTTTQNKPDRPAGVSPASGASVSLTPTLRSSAFSDPDADATHVASQWRIWVQDGSYSAPVFDSGTDSTNLTSTRIEAGILEEETTYYWQVRHQDNLGDWSDWSEEASFNTSEEDGDEDSLAWIWLAAALIVVVAAVVGLAIWQTRRLRKGGSTP